MKDRDMFGEDNRTCRETESPVLQPYVITHTHARMAPACTAFQVRSHFRYGGLTLCNPPAYARLWVGEPWMVRPYDSLSHMEVYQRPTVRSPKYPFLSRATTRAFDIPTSCIVLHPWRRLLHRLPRLRRIVQLGGSMQLPDQGAEGSTNASSLSPDRPWYNSWISLPLPSCHSSFCPVIPPFVRIFLVFLFLVLLYRSPYPNIRILRIHIVANKECKYGCSNHRGSSFTPRYPYRSERRSERLGGVEIRQSSRLQQHSGSVGTKSVISINNVF